MEFLQEIDFRLLNFIHTVLGNKWLDILCPILRTKTTWIPLYVVFIWFLWKKFSRDCWKIILAVVLLNAFSDILCAQILKPFFHRVRPCQISEFSSWLRTFSQCSQTFSFPSCHALNHATLASFLFIFFPKRYRWLLIIWVLSIAFSQVYIGVHFPLDVLGGMVIGSLIGWAGSKWIRNLMKNQSD
jgi:undecaprenyl-diphosphatase